MTGLTNLSKLAAAVAALIFAAGCSTSMSDYRAPSSFTVSNGAVAHVVQDALAHTIVAAHENGTPTVSCSGETSCTIAYTVQEPNGMLPSDDELLLPTRQIWKALFTDPQFQNGTITVSGPTTSVGGKSEISPLFNLFCDRDAASQIDWNNVQLNGLKTLCNYTPLVSNR
jgi:hypothetical protein